jgi:hypothetical protein
MLVVAGFFYSLQVSVHMWRARGQGNANTRAGCGAEFPPPPPPRAAQIYSAVKLFSVSDKSDIDNVQYWILERWVDFRTRYSAATRTAHSDTR